MSRLTRIVCDNPACHAQVERFTSDYYMTFHGMEDTPSGWYRLTYHQSKVTDASQEPEYPDEPMFFCSIGCVRNFSGHKKMPAQITWQDEA